MKVTRDLLFEEAENAGIPREQIEDLWKGLSVAVEDQPTYDPLQIASYFGALIVVAAVSYFFHLAWERVGGLGILAMALTYGCIFGAMGLHLLRARKLQVGGGLLVAVAVCMTPLAVYGVERTFLEDANWTLMELAALAAGSLAVYFLRVPFLLVPPACALWYLVIDLTPADQQSWTSVGFGVAVACAAWLLDRRTRNEYAFWLYLIGLTASWGGLSFMESGGPWGRLWYFLINVVLLVLSTLLRRRVFAVFGSLGVGGYLSYLIFRLFHGSLFLPMALTVIGVGIIVGTVAYQRNRARIDAFLANLANGQLAGWLQRGREGVTSTHN
ncbi:MAG: DUF2157 domain-containing protein [Candidatus Solibacter sp.]